MMLESDLNTISMDISTLETNCMGMSPAIMDACTAAIGSINIAAAVDFSQVILRIHLSSIVRRILEAGGRRGEREGGGGGERGEGGGEERGRGRHLPSFPFLWGHLPSSLSLNGNSSS